MTEHEWMQCAEPEAMLNWLKEKADDRKLRLFSCACCRTIWPFLCKPYRFAVARAEQFADGGIPLGKLRRAFERIYADADYFPEACAACGACDAIAHYGALWAAPKARLKLVEKAYQSPSVSRSSNPLYDAALATAARAQCRLLRCIVGNPFRERLPLPRLPETVRQMGEAIYHSGDFTALPVLADALEEAGVNDAEALGHLRGGGEHARGCWVVDWLLESA